MKAFKTIIAALLFMSATVASAECKNQSGVGRFASTSTNKGSVVQTATSTAVESNHATGKK